MTVSEVRSRYLAFFEKRGHAVIPSAPIVPGNDSTTLFTSSGMQPLVPYLLGQPHPAGTRLVNSQTSFRAEDIEEVGDNRHTTFFEMLGNWSLGDYFKKEQLPWIFEFLTSSEDGLGLDPNKLYVTVFDGDADAGMELDTESVEIWKKLYKEKGIDAELVRIGTEEAGYGKGMQGGRIFSYGAKKNWWSRSGVPANMPPGEPGGPDSEIFYDFGTPHDPSWGANCHVNCDCGRFVEICNSVFMQYVKNADGSFSELPKMNVDFGGGLERLTATGMGESDLFLIDAFAAARTRIEELSGKAYGSTPEVTRSYRVVLDHTRAAVFMFADDVLPSNTEAGYILRRLIRRAIRHADTLGIEASSLSDIAAGFTDAYKDAYPALAEKAAEIRIELEKEEAKFRKTLAQGIKMLEKHRSIKIKAPALVLNKKTGEAFFEGQTESEVFINAETAFKLFTTFGFPIELTEEIAKEAGKTVDRDGFTRLMKEHQAKSRTAAEGRFKGGLADHSDVTVRYHTSHHLLLAALRKLLGDHVHQRGSNITSERVRLDFSFERKLTPEELQAAEDLVNEKIQEALPVFATSMPKDEAMKLGAEQEFGVKYGDMVTVYSMGPKNATKDNPAFSESFSLEFCGGPHVENTSELATDGKRFKIVKEESVAAGIRRIKAVLT